MTKWHFRGEFCLTIETLRHYGRLVCEEKSNWGVVFFVTRSKGELGGHGGFWGALLLGVGVYHWEVKKLRDWLEGGGIERPAVFLGGGIRVRWGNKRMKTWSILRGCVFCYTEGERARRTRRFLRRFAFGGWGLLFRSLGIGWRGGGLRDLRSF